MSRLEKIEVQIRDLSSEELRDLRAWLAEFDAADWDRQFEADAASGKLDRLAKRALDDHAAGRSTEL